MDTWKHEMWSSSKIFFPIELHAWVFHCVKCMHEYFTSSSRAPPLDQACQPKHLEFSIPPCSKLHWTCLLIHLPTFPRLSKKIGILMLRSKFWIPTLCVPSITLSFFSGSKNKTTGPNGVVYAKPHITKPKLNLITVSALPEMEF